MKSPVTRILLLALIVLVIVIFFSFDLGQYFTLEYAKTQQAVLQDYYAQHQLLTIGGFFLTYVLVAALSLPGATIMTLLGGALFGVLIGTIIVSFASTLGATLAFWAARFLLRDSVQQRFADKLRAINQGIEKEGVFYLFTLRLIPLFPFFIINLLMGLTPLRAVQFFVVSQIGMLPGTIVYVNAGSQLAAIDSLRGILSPGLIFSFALLGIFPLIAKRIVDYFKSRKYLRHYKKPTRFDYNIVVIGGGSGGLVTAYIAAAVKAKVALIEKHKMGGDCLNTGCVPSKALIRSAKMLRYAQRAKDYGFKKTEVQFDFAEVMQRVQRVIQQIEPHDSIARYSQLGVDCITGEARIISPFEVEVNGKTLTTKNIVIATGARPLVPAIEGIEKIDYLTSDNVWELRKQPKRLLVLGGGPIGCELAQAFRRLGSEVAIVNRGAQLQAREDADVADMVMQQFREEGITLYNSHEAKRFVIEKGVKQLICEFEGREVAIEFEQLLVALGRQANVRGFGLEDLQVQVTKRGTVETNEFLQTNYPNIYACGDVAGPYQFTHTAAHQAWYASVNALFSPMKRFRVDYSVIPWATYTDPEVARVGLNEQQAKQQGVAYELTRYGIDDLDRAIADEEAHGMVKILTAPGKDKILGVTIVGSHAGDLIAEFVAAMKHGIGLNKILSTIHIYPTLAEANKYAAGVWKRNHQPAGLLRWVEKFHAWRRG